MIILPGNDHAAETASRFMAC